MCVPPDWLNDAPLSESTHAVSHTHLDVYKRQGYTRSAARAGDGQRAVAGGPGGHQSAADVVAEVECSVVAVSYTHLDVYKRQPVGCC